LQFEEGRPTILIMSTSTVQVIDPPALGKPNPLYGNITAAKLSPTSTLYTISGQIAIDPSTGQTPDGLAAQLPICLQRVEMCLEHVGAKKTDMIRLMYYLRQGAIEEYEAVEGKGSGLKLIAGVVAKWLDGHRPASCYNRSFGMTDDRYACEFEAMAVVSE
jgi:enamine deaminase RidA (YjgF/YER057c/UK114 family)